MFIIETGGTLNEKLERDILNFGNIKVGIEYIKESQNFRIKFGNLSQILLPFHSYMIMIKWNRNNFSTELNIYNYEHPKDRPVYTLRPDMYWFDFENPVCELVDIYNNDYHMITPMKCSLHSYPLLITNLKLYDKYLDKIESIKESIKYTTQHDHCLINDLARPISSGHGYTVK